MKNKYNNYAIEVAVELLNKLWSKLPHNIA